ncbi:MAG: tetratricopeptide repeat protein, partial [Sideroxyarcus sp.]|nr:tetratricopeptide repeat protein [Sideroxyarcus sp.]
MRWFMGGAKLSIIAVCVFVAGCGEVEPPHWVTKIQAFVGIAEAQDQLGWMYANGVGVPEDRMKAIEWYQKAAAQGYAPGQYSLGLQYATGVPKDAAKAVEWYQKAAGQGYSPAQSMLGNAYANGEGVEKDAPKAVEWYQKASLSEILCVRHNMLQKEHVCQARRARRNRQRRCRLSRKKSL